MADFKRLKIRDAMLILNDDLTVYYGGPAVKLCGRPYEAWVTLAPIEAIAGVGTSQPVINHEQSAVSVVLDLMDPVVTERRLIH